MNDILYIVVPAYNEEDCIKNSVDIITNKLVELIKLNKINKKSKLVVVDDGSYDNTFDILKNISNKNKYLMIIKLSRNFGHQNALYAGLMEVKDETSMVISMDADLQDDINVIDEMINDYYQGNEIVYGVRSSRDNDSFFKRNSAIVFYKIMDFLGVRLVYNSADFRLLSKKALDSLSQYKESNLFLRGIVPDLGFKSSKVYYGRKKRNFGVSKYNFKKMLNLAINGITSFSVKPIRFIICVGFICSFFTFLYLIYVIVSSFNNNSLVDGWTTIVVLITFFGSFNILCIGLVGEYISKIYLEVKDRPKYIIDSIIK